MHLEARRFAHDICHPNFLGFAGAQADSRLPSRRPGGQQARALTLEQIGTHVNVKATISPLFAVHNAWLLVPKRSSTDSSSTGPSKASAPRHASARPDSHTISASTIRETCMVSVEGSGRAKGWPATSALSQPATKGSDEWRARVPEIEICMPATRWVSRPVSHYCL